MDNLDDIISKIKNNSKAENKKLAEDLQKNMSEEQSDAFNKLLSNKTLMQKILASDEAKKIMNKLGGDTDGHQ